MGRTVISESLSVFTDVSSTGEETWIPAKRTLSVNGSVNVQGSTKGTLDAKDFFAMFDEIWSKLLMLAKELRDTLQFYNQKKQELGWGLEINTLHQSVKAIDNSYGGAKAGSIGGMFAGMMTVGGAFLGEVGMTVGNAMGQVVNGIGTWASGSETRKADAEKAIAELQNKGAQSYAKTLDDTLMKGYEVMQKMMDMGRNFIEVFNQVLRAISR